MSRLGIIDWGIGGVGILALLKARLGDIGVTYFSDTGVTPYGRMSRPELVARLERVTNHLAERGVTHLVVGCNAASTALPFLKPNALKTEGVIEPAIMKTLRAHPQKLGVIGGRRTILSGVYRRAFEAHDIDVRQRVAQPLSALIESGDVASDKLHSEAHRILAPLGKCSHILLACTHYPAILPILSECVSPETQFIDPADELAGIVAGWKLPAGGADEFLTTGDPDSMKRSAKAAFGYDIGRAKKTSL